MYNCHYQFEVSITAICVDSQKWGILRGLYVPPFSFKEHDLMLCHSGFGCFEGYNAVPLKLV